MAVLVEMTGYDPVAAASVTLRASSDDDSRVCHLNDTVWWPSLSSLPKLRYQFFDGDFGNRIDIPASSLKLAVEPWSDFGRYALADATIRIWTGEPGTAWNAWSLRFDGRVQKQPKLQDGIAEVSFGVDDRWLDTPLMDFYTGAGDMEGPAALLGTIKPLALGAPRFVPGVMIDTPNNVFQISAYGRIEGVEDALDGLIRFGSPVADYPTYEALVAATIANGSWATCLALGLARLGAPPAGQITFMVRGDKAGTGGWVRRPGALIRRIAELAGGGAKVDAATMAALDVARPWNLSLYISAQSTARDLIQRIAASVNAVVGISWTGKLFALPVAIGAPTMTLKADGTALPELSTVAQSETSTPYWRIAMQAERTWQVYTQQEVAFTIPKNERGSYNPAVTYVLGDIVTLDDGSRWHFVSNTPAIGSAPDDDNANWKRLTGAVNQQAIDDLTALISQLSEKFELFVGPTAPGVDDSKEGDWWQQTNADRTAVIATYRRVAGSGRLAIGGNRITIGGNPIALCWTPVTDARITAALTAAVDARDVADGKARGFTMASATDPEPVGENIGDFLVREYTDPPRVDHWTGVSWQTTATYGATRDQIEATEAAQASADAALADLANIASDDLLTPDEKPRVVQDVTVILSEKTGIDAQATSFGVTTEKTAYDGAVTALNLYLASLTMPVLWSNLTGNTVIVGATFRSKFADVYGARQALLNKMTDIAKARGDAANTAAGNAQSTANSAYSNAISALGQITIIASDGYLDRSEKPAAIAEWQAIVNDQPINDARATAFGITTEKATYDNAISALGTYLGSLTPSWSDTTQDTAITRATYTGKFTDAYYAEAALLDKIAEIASLRAGWTYISSRPVELTDGRIPSGLDSGGNVNDDKVDTPSIVSGAVTETQSQSNSGSFTGNGGNYDMITINIDMKRDGVCLVLVSAKLSYYGPSNPYFGFTVRADGVDKKALSDSSNRSIVNAFNVPIPMTQGSHAIVLNVGLGAGGQIGLGVGDATVVIIQIYS